MAYNEISVSIGHDNADWTRLVEGIREKEAQYRGIFDATTDGLVVNDMDGILVEANPAFCAMHGYTLDEMIGMNPQVFIHPDSLPLLGEYIETVRDGGTYQAQAIDIRKDGTEFPVEVHGRAFTFRGRPHILGVVRDITERVQAYELLEQRVADRTKELSTLLEVAKTLTSVLELQPLLGLILDQLKVVADYTGASILMLDDDSLTIVDTRGINPEQRLVGHTYVLSRVRELWDVMSRGEPIIVGDVRSDMPLAAMYRDAVGELLESALSHTQSWMAIPLKRKDRIIGMLALSHEEPGFYTDHHAGLALAIASQAAFAIENSRLYEQARELAAIEERSRLARDLHDSVTQVLFSVTLHARAAEVALARECANPDGQLAHNIHELTGLAQGALAEMRALIFELRPGALGEEGLLAGLRKHAAAISAREGIGVEIQGPEVRLRLQPSVEEHLFRLAQEALHNIVKHARARNATVSLACDAAGTLTLEVADNGDGFNVGDAWPGHLGLQTMRDRAWQIGGRIDIRSAPGQGTTVQVVVPRAMRGENHGA